MMMVQPLLHLFSCPRSHLEAWVALSLKKKSMSHIHKFDVNVTF